MSSPARTNLVAVQAVLGNDWNPDYEGGATNPTIQPYIDTATAMIDTVVIKAANQNYTFPGATPLGDSMTSVNLELMERWLAAHCYMVMQEQYQNRRGEGGGAGFIGKFGEALEQTFYGQMALASDPSGVLWQIGSLPPKRARAFYNGINYINWRGCPPVPPVTGS
jgi:hypothetical protein